MSVDFAADAAGSHIDVAATVKVEGKTGVEMEALTACSVACLTLTKCASGDRGMRITDLRVTEKIRRQSPGISRRSNPGSCSQSSSACPHP